MGTAWTDYRIFWREFRRTFHTTGAVAPSGRALSRALAYYVRGSGKGSGRGDRHLLPERPSGYFAQKVPVSFSGRRILEVGPGTGAVTRHIVAAMRPDDRLTLVEHNGEFVARLRERFDRESLFQQVADRVTIHHAGVEELPEDEPYDVVVSGLPLNNFSVEFVEQVLAKLERLMAPGGTLSFFEYIAIRRAKALVSGRAQRERLQGIAAAIDRVLAENEIRRDRVWVNVPPAYVHHLRCKE